MVANGFSPSSSTVSMSASIDFAMKLTDDMSSGKEHDRNTADDLCLSVNEARYIAASKRGLCVLLRLFCKL